jgi:hypothetical protein
MGVTSKLLSLYRVDQKIRGLRSRLDQAESYLRQQDTLLSILTEKQDAENSQIRQLEATEHNDENEIKSIEQHVEELRERMNNAQTSKEHSALLTEINTFKVNKDEIEGRAIETLNKLDELRTAAAETTAQAEERKKVRAVAFTERDEREAEIKDQLAELENDRKSVEADVPASALAVYTDRLVFDIEDVMAPCEEQNRRNMEYSCGACFQHMPVEQVNILLNRGDLTTCPACDAILYMEDALRESITEAAIKKRAAR